ncbi:MAG: hypothetical protein E7399_01130 [Ruminococcaceae bacterium]|nr:hypothetical protein [Oscillospiraceae bacterium]
MSNEKKKLATCNTCEKEIAKNAKVCPHCGGKVKKPFYKRVWFIALAVIIVIGIISNIGNGNETTTSQQEPKQQEQIEYISYDVSEMMNDLEGNAMSAEKKYNKQYVEITGRLSTIDSSGSYISLYPTDNDFAITGVQCYIQSEEQKAKILELSKGDIVTLTGKMKSVGEVLGYSLDIHSIH